MREGEHSCFLVVCKLSYLYFYMLRKTFIFLATLGFAFAILFVSILRTASVKYSFSDTFYYSDDQILGEEDSHIDYFLVNPGKVHPDSPLWPLKALRDRTWLFFTTNPGRKAELKLLFADKRLLASKVLFEKGNPELGFSTLTKAEKYLEQASLKEKENREKGIDTSDFLERIALASLKHFEVIEEILALAPEDARQGIVESQNYPRKIFLQSRDLLSQMGKTSPKNPFEW